MAMRTEVNRRQRRVGRVAISAPPCALEPWASCPICEPLCAGMAGKQGRGRGEMTNGQGPMTREGPRPNVQYCCADCEAEGTRDKGHGTWGARAGGFVWLKKCVGESQKGRWEIEGGGVVGLIGAEGTKARRGEGTEDEGGCCADCGGERRVGWVFGWWVMS